MKTLKYRFYVDDTGGEAFPRDLAESRSWSDGNGGGGQEAVALLLRAGVPRGRGAGAGQGACGSATGAGRALTADGGGCAQVDAVVERTAEIERREEQFLHQVLDKNRREDGAEEQTSVADAVATAVQWLCALVAAAASAVGVALLVTAAIPSTIQDGLVYSAAAVMAVIAASSTVGWIAAYSRSLAGLRVFLALAVAAIVAAALLQSEIELIYRSQEKLHSTLKVHNLTESEQDYILNGGQVPTLTQRFIFDGPQWFLSRLSEICESKSANQAFWDDGAGSLDSGLRNQTCVDGVVHGNMLAETILKPVIAGFLATVAVELAAASLLVVIADPYTFRRQNHPKSGSAQPRKHARQRKGRRVSTRTSVSFVDRMLNGVSQLVSVTVFVVAAALIALMWNLLSSCSLEVSSASVASSWHLRWGITTGVATVIGVLVIRFDWGIWVGGSLVCAGLVYNAITLRKLLRVLADLGISDTQYLLVGHPTHHVLHELKLWYTQASQQRCYVVSRWLSHVCSPSSSTSASEPGNQWDGSCQHEFGTLLINTIVVLIQFLSVVLGLDAILLVILVIPILRECSLWAWRSCSKPRCYIFSSRTPKSMSSKTRNLSIVPMKLFQRSSLAFSEAQRTYLRCVLSTDDDATCEVESAAFEAEWAKISRRQPLQAYQATSGYQTISGSSTEGVVIAERDFEAIIRSLVIHRLIVKCKLDVSISLASDGKLLFVQVSAPDNVLMARLCEKDDYELQFADAIDPGPGFWRKQRGEMERDVKVLEPHEVKQQFKLLLREREILSSSITPNTLLIQKSELEWLPNESLAQVSMRVNALHRISRFASGGFPPLDAANLYHAVPFVRYSPRPQLQFLFKKYPNQLDMATNTVRRSSVLRTVDYIRLTREILDEAFDLDTMLNCNVLASVQCLHSASRMDFCSREELANRWIAYWRYTSHTEHVTSDMISPTPPSSRLICKWKQLHAMLRNCGKRIARWAPHRQPIQDIRDYFGENIAFFFAWSKLYLQLMFIPALVVGGSISYSLILEGIPPPSGMLTSLWDFYQSSPSESNHLPKPYFSPFDYVVGFCTVFVMIMFVKVWERQSEWYRLKWGVASSESSRTSSSPGVDEYGFALLQTSQIARQLVSWGVIFFVVTCNAAIVLVLILLQGYAVASEWTNDVRVTVATSCLFQVILTQLIAGSGGTGGSLLSQLTTSLSKWENHQSEEAFSDSAVLKQFVLQFFVFFQGVTILLLIGIQVESENSQGSSPLLLELLIELQFLGAIAGSEGVLWLSKLFQDYQQHVLPRADSFAQIQTLILLMFVSRLTSRAVAVIRNASVLARVLENSNKSLSKAHNNRCSKEPVHYSSVETENEMPAYSGERKAYADFVIQLALASMLSSVFPLTPAFAFIDAAITLRLNALELACLTRRPDPKYRSVDNGIRLWCSCIRVVVKLSTATSIALIFYRSSWSAPHTEISIVRRLGTYLLAVVCLWLLIELLWLAVPSKSYMLVQTKIRQAYLVQRYAFGDDKEGDTGSSQGKYFGGGKQGRKRNEDKNDSLDAILRAANDQSRTNSEVELQNVQERIELLHRLNVAMRQKDNGISDPRMVPSDHADQAASSIPTPTEAMNSAKEAVVPSTSESVPAVVLGYPLTLNISLPGAADDNTSSISLSERPSISPPLRRSQSNSSSSSDQMVVGYYRRVIPPQQASGGVGLSEQPATSPASASVMPGLSTTAMIMGRRELEAPPDSSLPRNSPRSQPTTLPPPKRLSKLFTRGTPAQLHAPPGSLSDEGAALSSMPDPLTYQRKSSNSDALQDADNSHPLLSQPLSRKPETNLSTGFQVVDLEGMNAIAEAARRERFEFGGDPGKSFGLFGHLTYIVAC